MPFTHAEIHSLPKVLSAPRFATYLRETAGDKEAALELYLWNLKLSSAFLTPLHICEVVVRNSIISAIERTYGPNWPWERAFEISLRSPPTGYNPRRDLVALRRLPTAGKIVAELKFIFWVKMLTHTHDGAIWNAHFRIVFPNTDSLKSVQKLRSDGHINLDAIRDLRNRIAHHEPIFLRDMQKEYDRIRKIISWVDHSAANWLDKIQEVTNIIADKP